MRVDHHISVGDIVVGRFQPRRIDDVPGEIIDRIGRRASFEALFVYDDCASCAGQWAFKIPDEWQADALYIPEDYLVLERLISKADRSQDIPMTDASAASVPPRVFQAGEVVWGLLKPDATFDRPLSEKEAAALAALQGEPVRLTASHPRAEGEDWLFTASESTGLGALWFPFISFEETVSPAREIKPALYEDTWEDHLPDHVLLAWETFSPEQKALLQRWAQDLATAANEAQWDRDPPRDW